MKVLLLALMLSMSTVGAHAETPSPSEAKLAKGICLGGALTGRDVTTTWARDAFSGTYSVPTAFCLAGALSGNTSVTADWARGACKNVTSKAQGICLGGALTGKTVTTDWAQAACEGNYSVAKAYCMAGALSGDTAVTAEWARNACAGL